MGNIANEHRDDGDVSDQEVVCQFGFMLRRLSGKAGGALAESDLGL